MEMHQEWGTREERGWGDERDGRWVGDTGCDEAVDLICSPAPSFSAFLSVTCVLSCLLHLPFHSHFPLFLFNLLSFFLIAYFHFIIFFCTFSFLALAILLFSVYPCSFFWLLHLQNTRYPFILCIFVLGFLGDTLCNLSLYMHKHLTPSSFAPLPPTAAASLLGFPPSLCSAAKLVHWGSRKWGLQTIEWREM